MAKKKRRLSRRVLGALVGALWWAEPLRRPLLGLIKGFYVWDFLRRHGRLPLQPSRRFNDFLFSIKAGKEITHPLRRLVTDKEHGKAFITRHIGPGLTPRTLAILRSPDQLAAHVPDVFPVMAKPTHSSGKFLKISSAEEFAESRKIMAEWFRHDYFHASLERNYEGLEKKIIIEAYLDESFRLEGSVHCRNGIARIVSIIDRHTKERQSFSTDRTPLGVSLGYPLKELRVEDWRFFDRLLQHCETLAAPFSYIRVDFYTDGNSLLFGELTNIPAGANGRFFPENGEKIFSRSFFGD